MNTKAEVSYNPAGPEGKCWYVIIEGVSWRDNMYIRHDLTEHRYMMNEGGTYFDTPEEAQKVCDAYNNKGETQVEPKFKVGDKVRSDYYPQWVGKDLEVMEVTNYGSIFASPFGKLEPKHNSENGSLCFGAYQLTKVTEITTQTIQPGVTYETVSKGAYTCIYTENHLAWLKKYDDGVAYVWDATTGEAISLGEEWNLKREFVTPQ